MEELTKTQIVLLTLLVSFVTSIATGIVTVALVDQSSQGVGQTIQTVVEKTIETVIPGTKATSTDTVKVATTGGNGQPPTLSESDLMVSAVSKNTPSLVRIKQINTEPAYTFVGLGVVISPKGLIIADKGLFESVNANYVAVFPDGKTATMTRATLNASTTSVGIFSIGTSTSEKLSVPVFGDSTKLSLGQKVLTVSGSSKNIVIDGIISSLDKSDGGQNYIKPDFSVSDLAYGSILINLNGEIIGLKVGKIGEDNEFLSSNDLKRELGI
ncbi:MAG TPA: S1C family serine protease [Candidatus Paceibacterota bacterium]|nr:S1C family serine protease [Candidatus Paceibacterota bacterium]